MRRATAGVLAIAAVSIGAFAVAQGVKGEFKGFWGSKYSSRATQRAPSGALAMRTSLP